MEAKVVSKEKDAGKRDNVQKEICNGAGGNGNKISG